MSVPAHGRRALYRNPLGEVRAATRCSPRAYFYCPLVTSS